MMFSQYLNSHRIVKQHAKALIRLRVCAGWSEALLVAHTTLLEISCHGSYHFVVSHIGLWRTIITSEGTYWTLKDHIGLWMTDSEGPYWSQTDHIGLKDHNDLKDYTELWRTILDSEGLYWTRKDHNILLSVALFINLRCHFLAYNGISIS